jgi:hypothetical protein
MRWTVGTLSAATLGLVVLSRVDPSLRFPFIPPGIGIGQLPAQSVYFWVVVGTLLTVAVGIVASLQRRQFGWLAGLLAVGVVEIVDLVAITLYPWNGIVLPWFVFALLFYWGYVPVLAGLLGLVYSSGMRAPAAASGGGLAAGEHLTSKGA